MHEVEALVFLGNVKFCDIALLSQHNLTGEQ